MNSGKLRHVFTFQRKGTPEDRDSFGAVVPEWVEAFREWGEYQPVGSREFPLLQKRQSETTARFIIRYRSGIDPATYRVLHDGRTWNITDPLPDARKIQLTIEASEITEDIVATTQLGLYGGPSQAYGGVPVPPPTPSTLEMLIEEALFDLLSSDAGVSAFVSARIYPGVLPQECTYPAIAYRLVSREHHIKLEPRGSAGLADSRIRIFSTAASYAEAKRLEEVVRLCLQGFQGTIANGASPAEEVEIQGIFPLTNSDFYDDPTETFQAISDFAVWASEVQPT